MQHRKTLMLVLTALFAALTAVGAFFKIPFALAAISLQFLFTAMAGILLGAGYGALSQLPFLTKPSKQASSVSCIFPNCA